MKIVADTHIHLYPCYETARALRDLVVRLAGYDSGSQSAAFLTERNDCSAFCELRDGDGDPGDGIQVTVLDAGTLRIVVGDSAPLLLFAGRQIATSDRVEILALAQAEVLPDGRPAMETVESVLSTGGVPVLAWSPGKWLFSRSRIVRELLAGFGPDQLLIGDTTLRPPFWGEPRPMRKARDDGYQVVCGSDPLPFAGEELLMGRYASRMDGAFDESMPTESIRRLLMTPGTVQGAVGHRSGLFSWVRRMIR